jgi:CDP-glucose 4,6-dehydratase
MTTLKEFYNGKTVLVTGDTGFKGAWLATWLTALGARVIGYATQPPSQPSLFDACALDRHIVHVDGDVRDFARILYTVETHRPDIVFHLAAQALVRPAYEDPRGTFDVNVMGTVNVLEAARRADSVLAAVVITSDKVYLNVGWEWAYRESDRLGGHEAYSTSKACAELVAAVYENLGFQRFATPASSMPIASARAGNAIGGGDWARHRIIPDIVRAVAQHTTLVVRNPGASRPWQHALEALSGYLWLAVRLVEDPDGFRGPWNFGPREERMHTVKEIIDEVVRQWPDANLDVSLQPEDTGAEKLILAVDCSRSRHRLGWQATWSIDQTISATIEWYRRFYDKGDMFAFTLEQIARYTQDAATQGIAWACPDAGFVKMRTAVPNDPDAYRAVHREPEPRGNAEPGVR